MEFNEIFTFDKTLQIYLILLLMDFTTGFLKAYKIEGFKSRKLRDGIIRAITEILAILFSGIIDIAFGLSIMMIATKTLLIFKESISIIENFGILGVQLPAILTDKIQDLNPNKTVDENNDENNF